MANQTFSQLDVEQQSAVFVDAIKNINSSRTIGSYPLDNIQLELSQNLFSSLEDGKLVTSISVAKMGSSKKDIEDWIKANKKIFISQSHYAGLPTDLLSCPNKCIRFNVDSNPSPNIGDFIHFPYLGKSEQGLVVDVRPALDLGNNRIVRVIGSIAETKEKLFPLTEEQMKFLGKIGDTLYVYKDMLAATEINNLISVVLNCYEKD